MSDEAERVVVEGAGPGSNVIISSSSVEQDSAYRVGSINLTHITTLAGSTQIQQPTDLAERLHHYAFILTSTEYGSESS